MKNTPNYGLGILIRGAFNFNNSFSSSKFSKFSNGVEAKLVKLCFLSLNKIPKVVIYKVIIRVDQGASTFGMPRP